MRIHRWLQNPNIDLSSIPSVTFKNAASQSFAEQQRLPLNNPSVPHGIDTPPPSTQTIGSRTVHFETNAALRPILEGVRTQEELDDFLADIEQLRFVFKSSQPEDNTNSNSSFLFRRITGPLEGAP
jgi:hypothetical protein